MIYRLTKVEKQCLKKLKCIYEQFEDFFDYVTLSRWQLAVILTHIKHESNYNYKLKESLKYSEKRFKQIFNSKKYKKAKQLDLLPCKTKECEKQIGDIVYGHLGGYHYRGKGCIQLTGIANYTRVLAKINAILDTNIDLIKFNKLLTSNEAFGTLVVLVYFELNMLSRYDYFMDTFKFLNPYLPMKEKLKRYRTFKRIYGTLKRYMVDDLIEDIEDCLTLDIKV
jgi:predicted chitinase